MIDWLKANAWVLAISAATIISTFTLYGVRISAVEARVDRQGTAIATMQTALASQQSQYSALNAKLDAMNDLLVYIRSRVDDR